MFHERFTGKFHVKKVENIICFGPSVSKHSHVGTATDIFGHLSFRHGGK